MPSSQKTSKGLNKWVATDKPTMDDFVADNETASNEAMWKNEFDPNGDVNNKGGIPSYVSFAINNEKPETGTTNGWNWKKYLNGDAEMRKQFSFGDCTTQAAGGYTSASVSITDTPFTFIGTTNVCTGVRVISGYAAARVFGGTATVESIMAWSPVSRTAATNGSVLIDILITGKWK